jgi:MFS family permease
VPFTWWRFAVLGMCSLLSLQLYLTPCILISYNRSFLFAYDTGIVGGVLTLAAFEKDFRYTKAQATNINSNCVSILQAGAFFGCFLIWPIAARFGRRLSIVLSSLVFCLGGILQVVNTHSIGAFYAGRVISGFGVGAATVLVPMFSAEMAPKNMRGQLGSCFQLFFALGVCVSYWYFSSPKVAGKQLT